MNAIQNFAFEEHLVRIVDREGAPWFVGKDVCGVLGIVKHHQALESLDEDERGTCTIGTPSAGDGRGGGEQTAIIVSEPGVYRLVFRSRKPEAERFKRWLAHDVLPQIRRTGSYSGTAAPRPLPDLDNASIAVWRAKIDLIREARLQFGAARAKLLWTEIGLPAVPELPADDEPDRCLAHLLDWSVEGVTLREFIVAALRGDQEIGAVLAQRGIRIGNESFIVANAHPFVRKLYRGTRWKEAFRFLRRLPGATEARVMKFGRNFVSRGVELPAQLLDE